MAQNNSPQKPPEASGDPPRVVPAMPTVPSDQLYRGEPLVLVEGLRHCIGWQDARRYGPSFVVTARRLGGIKAVQRFPLSQQGWAEAWQVLSRLDADAATAVEARLAKLETGRRAAAALAALDARSLCNLESVTFDGGSDGGSLAKGQRYDLRFQDDRVIICPTRSANALVELPYADVDTVEVSGSANQTGAALGMISGFGLVGALLGYFILVPRVLGLLLGAVVLGLVGGLIAAVRSSSDTVVRVRGHDAEFQFLQLTPPDDVRRALSDPLMAIRKANAARADSVTKPAQQTADSLADQLAKLASLLQQDLITRDEFEHLKAKVIAQS